MMVDVRRVNLPGVGVLHTFLTDDGGKVGVIAHRSGQNDLISFSDVEDGDAGTKVSLRLTEDEAHTLAELLGGTQITESLSALDQLPGLTIDWFTVDYEHAVAGKPLGSPADSGALGVSVVAVVRRDQATPVPGPNFTVFPGDTIVVAGSPDNVSRVFEFFRHGAPVTAGFTADSPPGG